MIVAARQITARGTKKKDEREGRKNFQPVVRSEPAEGSKKMDPADQITDINHHYTGGLLPECSYYV